MTFHSCKRLPEGNFHDVIMKPEPRSPKPVLPVLRTKDPQDPAEPTGGSSTPQSTIHFTPGTEARPTKIHQDTNRLSVDQCDVSKKDT